MNCSLVVPWTIAVFKKLESGIIHLDYVKNPVIIVTVYDTQPPKHYSLELQRAPVNAVSDI